jgi:hypothetical protein
MTKIVARQGEWLKAFTACVSQGIMKKNILLKYLPYGQIVENF